MQSPELERVQKPNVLNQKLASLLPKIVLNRRGGERIPVLDFSKTSPRAFAAGLSPEDFELLMKYEKLNDADRQELRQERQIFLEHSRPDWKGR